MGLLDKLKSLGGKRKGESPKEDGSRGRRSKRSARSYESLPGGGSGKEAAETNPQRAAELAD